MNSTLSEKLATAYPAVGAITLVAGAPGWPELTQGKPLAADPLGAKKIAQPFRQRVLAGRSLGALTLL